METIRKIFLIVAFLCLILLLAGISRGSGQLWQPATVGLALGLAIGIGAVPALKGYQYTAWIITAVVAAMMYPAAFLSWGEFDLRNSWLVLLVVQFVMFGMGIQMRIQDFTGLATSGKGVLVGLLCQFSIMPVIGFLLTKAFSFDPEIAAGIILIGACSSGLASNVMVYIARANLVLSVTVTAVATLAAPFMTPFMMKLLAGTLVEIEFIGMMMQIIKIVIVPIGAALLHDYLKRASEKSWKAIKIITAFSFVWLIMLPLGYWDFLASNFSGAPLQSIEILSFFLGAEVIGVVYHLLASRFPKLDSFMPYVSMFGIVYFTTVTTAAGRENLLQVGLLLFLASVIHNTAGYFLGYWFSRALGLDKNSARSMAFEVGLQNGGMASGLAGVMGKLGTVGLAAAVFSPWMNISGSILANYWKKKPVVEKSGKKIKSTSAAMAKATAK